MAIVEIETIGDEVLVDLSSAAFQHDAVDILNGLVDQQPKHDYDGARRVVEHDPVLSELNGPREPFTALTTTHRLCSA